jgi:predicted secreted hydrolase
MRQRASCSGRRAASSLLLALALAGCGAQPGDGGSVAATLEVGELLGGMDTLHARAVEVPELRFPRDHGPHPGFRNEWWYFTGNLTAEDGREFGFLLTFFRSALTDSATFAAREGETSPWRSRHAWMAHFAVSDITGQTIHHGERFARDGAGLAGAEAEPFRVWLTDWQAVDPSYGGAGRPPLPGIGRPPGAAAVAAGPGDASGFRARLVAAEGDVAMDLVVEGGKPMVLQGDRGLSQKGPEPGNASIYYSFTRMPAAGTIRMGGREYRVTGYGWLDREWSTSALSPDLAGWDWMALQFDDNTELMLYRLRRQDGTTGEFSAGTFVAADGTVTRLGPADFVMTPTGSWNSPLDGTAWPTRWQVEMEPLGMRLEVTAAFDAQEMNVAVRYWEGAVRIRGTRGGTPVTGRGYLEMTGY